jgi:hypothetical protein
VSERDYLIAKAFRVPNAGTIKGKAKKSSKIYNHHPIKAKAKGPAKERAGSLIETQSLNSTPQRRATIQGMS